MAATIRCAPWSSSGKWVAVVAAAPCHGARGSWVSLKRRWAEEGVAVKGLGCSSSGRSSQVVAAKKSGKERKGGVAEAVDSAPVVPSVLENSEPDDMYMGRKLEGLEPDFWEGEKWDTFGFVIQYMWAFGILVSLMACGVAVKTYNSGATDFKDTAVFKEAMDSQVEMDPSVFESSDAQGFTEPDVAPPLE